MPATLCVGNHGGKLHSRGVHTVLDDVVITDVPRVKALREGIVALVRYDIP